MGRFYKNLKGSSKKIQCCGTVTIYCCSSSSFYLGKVLVLVTVPVPVPDLDLFSIFFNNKKFVQNLAFSMVEAAFFPIS
jgi:hypothetical protein